MEDLILLEEDRAKLDGIVQQMISNNESEDNIQFVVNDFKSKYGKKKEDSGVEYTSDLGILEMQPVEQSADAQETEQPTFRIPTDEEFDFIDQFGFLVRFAVHHLH